MKNLKSILFSLTAAILITLSTTEMCFAQLNTNDGYLYFKGTNHYLFGNNGRDLKFRANHLNSSITLFNNLENKLGGVLGHENAGKKYFGLLDADGDWTYISKQDDWTEFRIDKEVKLKLNNNGQVNIPGTRDASETPGSGVLEIAGALRLDGNEIITNTNKPLYINYSNNGDVNFDNGTLIVDASANKVAIGNVDTNPKDYQLFVEKGILTEQVKVAVKSTGEWSDYVFEEDYNLMTIEELENYVSKNKHLPNVPSAEEVVKNGIDMAQMDAKLLEKIEEAYLYIIELKQEVEQLKTQINNKQ